MKRIIMLFLVLRSCSLLAQFDQSTVYVGGMATYSFSKNTELSGDGENSIQSSLVNVSIGMFATKQLLIGLSFGLLSNKETVEEVADPTGLYYYEELEEKSSSYTAGPFVRYYIVNGLYGEASYITGKSKVRTEYDMVDLQNQVFLSGWEETKQTIKGFSLGAGYSIFLDKNKKVALDVSLAYQNYKAASKFSGIAAGLGISGFLFKSKTE
jgi:hypothetical protein